VTEPAFLLDTNICIYLAEDLSDRLVQRVEACQIGSLVTSAIAFAEFARGIDWAQPKVEDTVARLFAAIEILPFDRMAARAYANLPFARNRYDRLIAAHALALGITLVTANPKDFRDIPGLKVEDWTR
jgi:tRNA(fMet)-specific endonuclease VapC